MDGRFHSGSITTGHCLGAVRQAGAALALSGGAIVGVTASLSDITRRKQAEESQRALARRVVEVQEEERRAIARELHDESVRC